MHIKRLRLIMESCFILLGALLLFMDAICLDLFMAATLLLIIMTIILANTWAKKK